MRDNKNIFKIIKREEVYKELNQIIPIPEDIYLKKLPINIPLSSLIKYNGIEKTERYLNKNIEDWDGTPEYLTKVFNFIFDSNHIFLDGEEAIFYPTPKAKGVKMPATELQEFFINTHNIMFREAPYFQMDNFYFLFLREKKIVVFEHPGIVYDIQAVHT